MLTIFTKFTKFFKALPQNWKLFFLTLLNKIYERGATPKAWSLISIKMLYKKGNPADLNNYRPIALINVIEKVFTQILAERLNCWMNSGNQLPEFQAGFRKKEVVLIIFSRFIFCCKVC